MSCWYHYYVKTTSFPSNNDISVTSTVPLDCDNGVHVEFRKHLIFVSWGIFQNFEKTYVHLLLSIFPMEYKDMFVIYCLYRKESGHQLLWNTGLVSSWLQWALRINIKQINTGWRIYNGVSKLCHHWLRWWLVTRAAQIYLVITTTGAGSIFCEQMSVNIIKMRRL